MIQRRRVSTRAVVATALVGLWGLAQLILTAFLGAMAATGQPFGPSALVTSVLVGLGAAVTLVPVILWLRSSGTRRLWPTVAPGLCTLVAVSGFVVYLVSLPSLGP